MSPSRMATGSRSAAKRASSAGGKAASRWFCLEPCGTETASGCGFTGSPPRGAFHADAAIPDEAAAAVEHRLAADAELLMRPVGVGPAEEEIQERLPRLDAGAQ